MAKAKKEKKAAKDQAWPRPGTMGAVIVEQLLAGKTTEQVIARVKEKWSKAKASLTPGGIGWWRNAMRQHGLKVPEPKVPAGKPAKASRKTVKKATRKVAPPAAPDAAPAEPAEKVA